MLQWVILHLAVALAGTWLALRYAIWQNLVDHPGHRRSHQVATPRGGGASIVVALLVAAGAMALRDPQQQLVLIAFAGGLTLVAIAGVVDDHRPVSPWLRLAAHAAAALLLALAVGHGTADWRLPVAVFLAAAVLTNVWNFMDGINGLAASQAMIVAAVIAAAQWSVGGVWAWMAVALAAACAGFLPYNFPRARIFLGDVGSGSIGYCIAVLATVPFVPTKNNSWLLAFPVSAFLVDAGLTLLRRVIRGETWWTAHSQHAYQAWARRAGHTRVTLAYAGWTLAGSAVMLGGRNAPTAFMLCSAMAWYTAAGLSWWLLQRMERESGPGRPGESKDT